MNPGARLAIGTAQFGLPYGVSNDQGMVRADVAAGILALARESGCDTLDTAVAYGESERRLGEIGVGGWRVITKLPALPAEIGDVTAWARLQIEGSLERLRTSRLSGLLLHRPADLLTTGGDALYAELVCAREAGLVEKIGISIYDPADIEQVWPRFKFDLVQAPFNVLDRRLPTSGWLTRLRDEGVETHVRSAFLQGLLLMTPATRPPYFAPWEPLLTRWEAWLRETGASAVDACLGFVDSFSGVDRIVVGVQSVAQMQEVLHALDRSPVLPPADLACDDLGLIDPSRWVIQ